MLTRVYLCVRWDKNCGIRTDHRTNKTFLGVGRMDSIRVPILYIIYCFFSKMYKFFSLFVHLSYTLLYIWFDQAKYTRDISHEKLVQCRGERYYRSGIVSRILPNTPPCIMSQWSFLSVRTVNKCKEKEELHCLQITEHESLSQSVHVSGSKVVFG